MNIKKSNTFVGDSVKIAGSPIEYKRGLKDPNYNTMIFPFSKGGTKQFNMINMKTPINYQGYTNGKITDSGTAYPGQYFNVNGDTVVEKRIPKAQVGRNNKALNLTEVLSASYKQQHNEPAIVINRMMPKELATYNEPEASRHPMLDYKINNPVLTAPYTRPSHAFDNFNGPVMNDNSNQPFKAELPTKYNLYDNHMNQFNKNQDVQPIISFGQNQNFDPSARKTYSNDTQTKNSGNSEENNQGDKKINKWKESFANMTPGDIMQNLPINSAYNLTKYLTQSPTVEQSIYNRNSDNSLAILKNQKAAFNINPVLVNDRMMRNTINDNVSSGQGRIAALLQNSTNTNNQLRSAAMRNASENNRLGSQYADALYKDGELKAGEDRRIYENNLRNLALHNKYLDDSILGFDKDIDNLGKTANQSLYNTRQIDLLNQSGMEYGYNRETGKVTPTKKHEGVSANAKGGYTTKLNAYLSKINSYDINV